MPFTINPIKKAIVKRELLKCKSARAALKAANYSPASIRQSTHCAVVKESIAEIMLGFDKKMITPEFVLSGLLKELLKPEIDTRDKLRIYELYGKYLKMFNDTFQSVGLDLSQFVINFNFTTQPIEPKQVIDVSKQVITNKDK